MTMLRRAKLLASRLIWIAPLAVAMLLAACQNGNTGGGY